MKNKRTSFFRRTGLWVSRSTGNQAVELLKTQKKAMSDKMVKIDTYLRKKLAHLTLSIATTFEKKVS